MRTPPNALRLSAARVAWTLALTAVFTLLALWDASLDELWRTLQSTDWVWIAAAAALYVLTTLLKAARWQAFFARRVPFRALFGALTIGQVVNFVVPARFGEVARVLVLRRHSDERLAHVAGTVGAEKAVDVVALALLCAIVLPVVSAPGWLLESWARMLLVAAGLVTVIALLLWRREALQSALQRLVGRFGAGSVDEQFGLLLGGLASLKERTVWMAVVPQTVLVVGLMVGTNLAVFRALHMPESWLTATLLLIVLQVGVAVPSTPGKIGVFQTLVQLTLALFGTDREVSLGYGLLLYLVIVVSQIALAGPFLWQELAHWRTGRLPATSS